MIIWTLLISTQVSSQTQNFAPNEKRFIETYSKLTSFINTGSDSLEFYSQKFEKEFTSFIRNNPNTLSYAFKNLIDSNFCDVRTSKDGNFRIYDWDTWTGGTMHFFREIYQWRANGKVFTCIPKYEEGDPGLYCSHIFTLEIKGQTYYLVITGAILSTIDAEQSISVYQIKNSKLEDTARLFRTKTKLLNSLDLEFNPLSVDNPDNIITYDETHRIVYIPVINSQADVTKKKMIYKLMNNNFNFIGFDKEK